MLVIKNYKKIKNQYFGDWQIGKIEEMKEHEKEHYEYFEQYEKCGLLLKMKS